MGIRDYKKREFAGEDYFIFFKYEKPIGLSGLYHIEEDRFMSGSWFFEPNESFEYAIASALIVRLIAFNLRGKE